MSDVGQASAGRAGGPEFRAIRRWVNSVPTVGAGVRIGPGDDVAVVDVGGALAVSTDTLVEGTHFTAAARPQDVGWKALAAALSDLAASRSTPLGAVVSVTIRPDQMTAWADAVMAGLGDCARAYECPILGGDTTVTNGNAVIGVTVLGRGDSMLPRSGAVPGDVLQISGEVGWAAAGLAGLGGERAHAAFHRPKPRLDLVDTLADAHAAIDVSDGLLADAAHLADASNVTLVLDDAASESLVAAVGADRARRFAHSGGEDYEVLAAAPALLPGFIAIGRVEAREDVDLRWSNGTPVPLNDRGWVHGASP